MKHFHSSVGFLIILWLSLNLCAVTASEFHLDGDYLIGGLFDIHHVNSSVYLRRPEAIDCSSQAFSLSNYRKVQLMRFSVEQINNSTNLLPNVSLGYDIFDQCSDTQNFPEMFNLMSENGVVQPWDEPQTKNFSIEPKAIAVVGAFTSTNTLAVAPLFMSKLIPMVSYGAASSALSQKSKFPSFLRTVHSNKEIIDVMANIIVHFSWRWVAFLYSDNDFGVDGLELFIKAIKDTEICLAYSKGLNDDTEYSQTFKILEEQKLNTIIVFSTDLHGEALIESAIRLNVTKKVWITGDTWSLNKRLLALEGIKNIGTVLGVAQSVLPIPGFDNFIYSTQGQRPKEHGFCNQDCNCSNIIPEDIISMDPSFSFAVYSAVYAIAHALHNVLQCEAIKCNHDIKVHPYKVLEELRKSNFTLLNVSIGFNDDGNPMFGSYSIVFWNHRSIAEEIGFYKFYPSVSFFINSSKIKWFTNQKVPISQCSQECPSGYAKTQTGVHKCCFKCEICPNGTYINTAEDPYNCVSCKETEWSEPGSTKCSQRLMEYVPFTDAGAILIITGACILVGLTVAVTFLFTINYTTPVVKSAGGPMCFLILSCLILCSLSVFFYFGKPTTVSCILRYLPFLLFYTVCLACFVVRSFQIVCIFKIAAKIPKLQNWWMKYHGQWLVITGAFVIQVIFLISSYCVGTPIPHRDAVSYKDRIILGCNINIAATIVSVIVPLSLCTLCFIFSYMGKDLPKNYNEAKAITFCLLLLIFTWIIFATGYILYQGRHIHTFNALAVLSSLFSFLLWYFLPKCYIIVLQPHKNTQQYFQGLIQNYTKAISH
ncbi:taste receptor type 1 member 1-like [Fundulus heteroclitus]|uniref:taste receptor type 1 member 1-like n=1 Tax=Fundulus heteroclitus TaxID=8078 RepID=UPI00165C2AEC|nr:taste receptor type 1 member 1-like [Fundulus heteroclitus]